MIARHHYEVHPTGGSLRVFREFLWLGVDSDKIAVSHPAHQPFPHYGCQSLCINYQLIDQN
jgi:hypothetical protein